MNKPVVVLQGWVLVCYHEDPYKAPEDQPIRLTGKVYGHPNHEDGTVVTTSRVLDKLDDETFETRNTIYKVGKKNEKYQTYLNDYNNMEIQN